MGALRLTTSRAASLGDYHVGRPPTPSAACAYDGSAKRKTMPYDVEIRAVAFVRRLLRLNGARMLTQGSLTNGQPRNLVLVALALFAVALRPAHRERTTDFDVHVAQVVSRTPCASTVGGRSWSCHPSIVPTSALRRPPESWKSMHTDSG